MLVVSLCNTHTGAERIIRPRSLRWPIKAQYQIRLLIIRLLKEFQ